MPDAEGDEAAKGTREGGGAQEPEDADAELVALVPEREVVHDACAKEAFEDADEDAAYEEGGERGGGVLEKGDCAEATDGECDPLLWRGYGQALVLGTGYLGRGSLPLKEGRHGILCSRVFERAQAPRRIS